MPKLKLQFFGYLMWTTDSLEKTLMLGKIEGGRRRGRQRMRWLDGITNSMDMNLRNFGRQWRTRKPCVLQSMGSQRVGHDLATIAKCFWVHEWISPASSILFLGLLYQFFTTAMTSPEKQNIQNWTLDLSDGIAAVQQTFITFTKSSVWMKIYFCWLLASIFWERFFSLLATPPFLSDPLCWPPELGDGSAFSGIICLDFPAVNFPSAWGLRDQTPHACPLAACSEMGQSWLLLNGSKTCHKELSQVPSAALNKLPSPSDWASSFFFLMRSNPKNHLHPASSANSSFPH